MFWFEEKYNDFILDNVSFGTFSVFRTFYFSEGKAEKSPIYYVENRTEKIVAKSEW